MARDNCGGVSDAETRPRRGRPLWVEVHQHGGEPRSLAGDGNTARERCLPCSALPADECDREHWLAIMLSYAGYIFILDITLNRISEARRAGVALQALKGCHDASWNSDSYCREALGPQ